MNYKLLLVICFSLVCLSFQSCLKDNTAEAPEFSFNQSEEILHYLESQGDFINSADCPAVIGADELYDSLNKYLVIDIRPSAEYIAGHIENSINVSHANLLTVLDSIKYLNFGKVIIISRNGQAAAYYTSLLRIAGYSNVYSLYYGLAGWNPDFATEWLNALYTIEQKEEFSSEDSDKNEFSTLPDVKYNSGLSVKEKIKERAAALSVIEFSENTESSKEGFISIGREPFMNRFHNIKDDYLVCLTNNDGYIYILGPHWVFMHLNGAVQYNPPVFSDFKSSKFLQTIPKNRKTIIYCYDGVRSAFFTAYLNFLGYDTASLLYGLNATSHDFLGMIPTLSKYYFDASEIRSYPYVK